MTATAFLRKCALLTGAAFMAATPVLADVKDGVDAWGRGEYKKAVEEWRAPALQGNPDAQFNMGQAYKLGRGVDANLDVALDWYSRAAKQGHLQASDSMGHLLHYKGRVPEALPYLEASSRRGEPRSQYLLATELFNGVNTTKNWVRAYALMTRASSAGMSAASRSLAQMDKFIPLEQRQQGTALAGQLLQQEESVRKQAIAGFPIDTSPAAPVSQPVSVPPSNPAPQKVEPGFPSNLPAVGVPQKAPAPQTAPVQSAPPVAAPTSPPATKGNYRIQLGAFGQEANARKLWNRLEGRVSGLSALQPYLKASGSITRLQAGPFSNKGSAASMCSKIKSAGQDCIVISRF